TPIGTYTGGDGLVPLVITFGASSTLASAQALAQDITFRTDAPLGLAPRRVSFSVIDSLGQKSATAFKAVDVDPDLLPPNTQVALSSSLGTGSAVYGQTVTLTATVTNLVGSGVPTGTVTFEQGGFALGTVGLARAARP